MDRTAVNRPMLTGIAGIDLIYPIGKGQRQLIIGDKKNRKNANCIRYYCKPKQTYQKN